ncbi:MAG: response regulator [Pedobacter sp.]|nr:MAG: response regulator [Pedobacter sp.]
MNNESQTEIEEERCRALLSYEILDTSSEQIYDDLVALASSICEVPFAAFGLIDHERLWFKAKIGIADTFLPKNSSFCIHTLNLSQALTVNDLSKDPRFSENPLVTGNPAFKFYNGTSIKNNNGVALGAVCVLDTKPRILNDHQNKALEIISRQITSHLESRKISLKEKEIKKSYARSVERMNQLFDLSSDFLIIVGKDGIIKKASHSSRRILAPAHESFEGKFFDEALPSDEIQKFNIAITLAITTLNPQKINSTLIDIYRNMVEISWQIHTTVDGDIYILGHDITEHLKMQNELNLAKINAEELTSQKAEFLAVISHEIRTPINGILGMTELLSDTVFTPNIQEKFKIIQSCSNHLLDLVNSILDFTKLESNKVQLDESTFSVHESIYSVAERLKLKLEQKKLTLKFSLASDSVTWVLGDSFKFEQVLTNLLSNAIKFTPQGFIEIIYRSEELESERLRLFVEVIDSGVGIAPQNINKLFTAFTQEDVSTTRKYGGTGLGLAIVRSLCELMGGSITVRSKVGCGSHFCLNLVVRKTVPLLNENSYNPPPYKELKNLNLEILVAEDNRTNQLVILGLLGKLGLTADLASNGKEVLEKIYDKDYDIVFMDFHMPDMDGFEASKALVALGLKHKPIIVGLSASTHKTELEKARECGMQQFLPKPVTSEALREMILNLTKK